MKILIPKHLIADLAEVGDFVVVDADEDDPILSEEITRQGETGVHHREPVGVVATGGLGVRGEALAVRSLTGLLEVAGERIGEVVFVDEVVPRVVRGIDVDHLDLAQIRLLEELQDFEVVPFDDQVAGLVLVDALASLRAERTEGGALRRFDCLGFAGPGEAVPLATRLYVFPERLLQALEIDLAVSDGLGKQHRE